MAQVVSEKQKVQNPTNSLIKLIIFLPDENHPIEDKQIWSWDDVITVTKNMNSSVHLDKFVYDPNKSTGDVAIQATRGMFRFATGSLGSDAYKIKIPYGTLACAVDDDVARPASCHHGDTAPSVRPTRKKTGAKKGAGI